MVSVLGPLLFSWNLKIRLVPNDWSFKLVTMKTITATEFKSKCLQLLDEVQRSGQDLVISKRGKPVARVVAERESKPWLALRGKGSYRSDPFEPVIRETEIDVLK